jgi:hypothetical protein
MANYDGASTKRIGKGLSVAITLLIKIALGLGCNIDDDELDYINSTKTSLEKLKG